MGPGGFKPGVGRWQSFPDPWKFSRGEKQKENFFQPLKSCFFEICQLEGSPIANALWATGKAPEKFTACYHGCLEGKIKKQLFRLWKVVFWNLPAGRVSHCNCALGSWKSTWKAHCLLSRVSGRENQKNNFSGFEKLFFEICQLEGSPISIALWNVCPVYIVGTGICCCHCVAASFHTDLTKSPRSKFKNISRTSAELALNLADSYDMLLLGNYCWIRRQHGQDLEDVHQTLVKETESTEFDFNDKLLMHSILNHLGCLKPGRQSGYSHQP